MRHVSFETAQKYLYLLLLVLLPTQFGKHFWPSFSFVSGLRIDYLSPTLYITDILIILLLISTTKSILENGVKIAKDKKLFIQNKGVVYGIGIFLFVVFIGIGFSKSPLAGLFGLVKVLEMLFFGWYTARVIKTQAMSVLSGLAVSIALIFQSLLSLVQFFTKGSVGGIFYFFGERMYSALTPGISNAAIGGQLVLRPYGTLPHPNVLAGFLLLMVLFILGLWNDYTKKQKIFVGCVMLLSVVALFFTLSRVTILVFGCFVLFELGKRFFVKQSKKVYGGVILAALLFVIVVSTTPLAGRFLSTSLSEEAFVLRENLSTHAFWMLWSHPFWGVGLNNFLQNLPAPRGTIALYSQIQPVHNIYLLIFAQVGFIGGCFFLVVLYRMFVHIVVHTPSSLSTHAVSLMFVSLLLIGFFDHYFLTLQQGQLLFAFVGGVIYSQRMSTNPKKVAKRKKEKVYTKSL